jgi:hypothetical protein
MNGSDLRSFAALKGVPNAYFATSVDQLGVFFFSFDRRSFLYVDFETGEDTNLECKAMHSKELRKMVEVGRFCSVVDDGDKNRTVLLVPMKETNENCDTCIYFVASFLADSREINNSFTQIADLSRGKRENR